ncbi:MAG TPA: SRPBCC family protein [Candidatus Paceibacterota bacterium]|nr:SRPBCC family protein [Candidatus Paceibacterota bacterium]
MEPIVVTTLVHAPVERVWSDYTSPEAITVWNTASPDWHTPYAENDLREGGRFLSRMEAKDGSFGFDFAGNYNAVVEHERIAYTMDDGRSVEVLFRSEGENTHMTVSFAPESENPVELQREGWQAILDSFTRYAEAAA